MNRSFSAVLGTVLVALLGCGDDTTTGSGGSGSTSSGAGGDDTSTTTTTSTTTGTTTTTTGGGGDTGVGGDPTGGGAGGAGQGGAPGTGGAPSTAPCAAECANDPGCDQVPIEPGDACQTCIGEEVAAGFGSECAVEGATGACCGDDPGCSEFVSCLINSGGDTQGCAAENPGGAAKAIACTAASCGDCGDGSTGGEGGGGVGGGSGTAPCSDECANDAGCAEMPADPGDECRICVQTEVGAQSQCAVDGAFGDCCQLDVDCPDFIDCVVGGGGQAACAQQYPEGFARAEQCLLASCGDCGMPM